MSDYNQLLPSNYFNFTVKPSLNELYPEKNGVFGLRHSKLVSDWDKMKDTIHYDKPKLEFIDTVNEFVILNPPGKLQFIEMFIKEPELYSPNPGCYSLVDEIKSDPERFIIFNKLKQVVSQDFRNSSL